jgi:hypothetical protein
MEELVLRAASSNPASVEVYFGYKLFDSFVRSISKIEFAKLKATLSSYDGWELRTSENLRGRGSKKKNVEITSESSRIETVEGEIELGDGLWMSVVKVTSNDSNIDSSGMVPFFKHARQVTFTRKRVQISLTQHCDFSTFSPGDWMYTVCIRTTDVGDKISCLRTCSYSTDIIQILKQFRNSDKQVT